MKKTLILSSLFLLVGFANANTTVNATITDSTGQIFSMGTYQADYIRPASNQGTVPTVNGVPIQEHGIVGQLNTVGFFSVSLADVNQIVPAGGQWQFTICPNASSACSIIVTQSMVTGGSVDLSTYLSARVTVPQVNPSNINRAYNDTEVTAVTGTFYYDVILNCIKFYNGSGWACVGTGGGGGGTPGTPSLSFQYNNAGTFAGTTDPNGLNTISFDSTLGRMNVCNIDNVRYASCFNFIQSPAGTLTGGTPATITLTPGPRGIDTSNNATFPYYLYVAGTGTAEKVLITGGTCTVQGGPSCTVTFTPTNSHTAGWTIQSATGGFAEAGLDANGTNSGPVKIENRPAGSPDTPGSVGNNKYNVIFYAPWFIRCSYCVIDGNGGSFALNNFRAVMVIPSVNSVHVTIQNIRFMPMYTKAHATITQTSCAANTATITSTLNPVVGEMVDIQLTNNSFYWGPHIVTSASPTQWTYTATGCAVSAETTAGGNSYQGAAIEDNGSGTRIISVGLSFGGAPYDKVWDNGIVVLNDQAGMVIDGLTTEGHGGCDANYCGSAVYAPGNFTVNPAVLNIVNSNMSVGCTMNGVTAYNGNTVAIDNTIIQAYAMWAVNGGTQRGGFGGIKMTNNYNEIGSCTNPIYTPDQAAGVIWWSNAVTELGGEPAQGQLPIFCTGGGTTFYYYLAVRDLGNTVTSPLLYIGSGSSAGACTIKWPRAADAAVQYDIIRSTDAVNAPTTATCAGGTPTACGSRTIGVAQCNGSLQCSFVDDVTQNTTAYTVLLPDFAGSGIGGATYNPTFNFFPGNFVLQGNATLNIAGGNVGNSSIGVNGVVATNGIGPVVTDGGATTIGRTYIRVQNTRGFTSAGSMIKIYDPRTSAVTNNTMGRISFINPAKGTGGHSYGTGAYWLTLATPKSDEAVAGSASLIADPNDSGIGTEVGGNNPALYTMGYASPVAHSFYVGSLLDGLSWKERLTSSVKEFAINTQFDLPMLSFLGCTDCGPFNRSTAFTNDPLQTPPNLSGSWTTLLGTWTIGTGAAFPSGNYAYASALVNEGGIQKAYAFYSGVSFTSDQIVQINMQPTNSVIGVCVRMQNATPLTAYCLVSGGNSRTLVRILAGVTTILAGGGPSNVPNNAVVKITAIGSQITVTINGIQTFQVTDTNITGGQPGIYAQNFAFSTQGLRNFYADSVGFTAVEPLTANNVTASTIKVNGSSQISTGTVSNTDLAGTLTFTAATTSTTYTFTGTYTNHPVCTLTPEFDIGANRLWWSTINTTTLQASSNANQTGTIDYHCIGRN